MTTKRGTATVWQVTCTPKSARNPRSCEWFAHRVPALECFEKFCKGARVSDAIALDKVVVADDAGMKSLVAGLLNGESREVGRVSVAYQGPERKD